MYKDVEVDYNKKPNNQAGNSTPAFGVGGFGDPNFVGNDMNMTMGNGNDMFAGNTFGGGNTMGHDTFGGGAYGGSDGGSYGHQQAEMMRRETMFQGGNSMMGGAYGNDTTGQNWGGNGGGSFGAAHNTTGYQRGGGYQGPEVRRVLPSLLKLNHIFA